MAYGDKIVDTALYGEHIPLTCKNHPNLRWSTKNIERIGARSIFFTSGRAGTVDECQCPASDLIPVDKE